MRHAEVKGMESGIFTTWTSATMVDSAKTDTAAKFDAGSPLYVKGWEMLPSDAMHQVGWPVEHARHTPQLARVAMTTWSPTFTDLTDEPTASTMPAPSWPSTAGGFHGMVPLITERSEWQTPAAWTETFTWVGPGSPIPSSSVTSTPSPV